MDRPFGTKYVLQTHNLDLKMLSITYFLHAFSKILHGIKSGNELRRKKLTPQFIYIPPPLMSIH